MRLDGRLQVFRECGYYVGRHRAGPSDSKEAILAGARSISEFRVTQADLGSSTRVVLFQGASLKSADPGPDSFRDPNFERTLTHHFRTARLLVLGFELADHSRGLVVEGGDDLVGVLFRVVKSQAADREIDDFMTVPRSRPG
jgi:hypothetical protein